MKSLREYLDILNGDMASIATYHVKIVSDFVYVGFS